MQQETFRIAGNGHGPELFLRHQVPLLASGAEPVLYIHGATFPSGLSVAFELEGRSWMGDLATAGFSVWALDFAGYGDSGRYREMAEEPDASLPLGRAPEAADQIARAVRFVLEREGATRISLIAHSWGSMPASLFATQEPERVGRLVLFAPIVERQAPASPGPALQLGGWRPWTVEDQRSRFVEDVPPGHPPTLDPRAFEEWARTYVATDPESGRRDPAAVRTPTGPLADILEAWRGHLPYDPGRIVAPTLIVRGEWDSHSTDSDASWLFHALDSTPSKRDVKLSQGTHFMHLESGRFELYNAVRSFLSSQDQPPPHPSQGPGVAVIFEVRPKAQRYQGYLDLAAKLRPELAKIDGFQSIERFESLSEKGKLLSLSFWRDEESVAAWRRHEEHRRAQASGREEIFEYYRLRVAGVLRDYGMFDREQVPRGDHEAPGDNDATCEISEVEQ